MRIVVTGGAGFVGSHLVDRLLRDGHFVVVVDSLITGDYENLPLRNHRLSILREDVSAGLRIALGVDRVYHLASPASPEDYTRYPRETLEAGSTGTFNALDLARRKNARFLLASSSEVYGDPERHPQHESYNGNVSPTGPRSMYDEAKRFSEAAAAAMGDTQDVRIARIFNTYGPRMKIRDGRVIPTFIRQALNSEPMTVHSPGTQTRSLCYVDDLIEGLVRLMEYDRPYRRGHTVVPINLGSDEEIDMQNLAITIGRIARSSSRLEYVDGRPEDPVQRQPNLHRALQYLAWRPSFTLEYGLAKTIQWARAEEW